jgi:hypothetical protein
MRLRPTNRAYFDLRWRDGDGPEHVMRGPAEIGNGGIYAPLLKGIDTSSTDRRYAFELGVIWNDEPGI